MFELHDKVKLITARRLPVGYIQKEKHRGRYQVALMSNQYMKHNHILLQMHAVIQIITVTNFLLTHLSICWTVFFHSVPFSQSYTHAVNQDVSNRTK